MKTLSSLTFAAALISQPLFGAIIFDGTTVNIGDWDHNGNNFGTIADPTDASNTVLNATGQLGNRVSGEAIPAIDNTSIAVLSFDFYLPSGTQDVGIGLTETSSLSGINQADGSFHAPLLRIDDGVLSPYNGNGSGGGSYVNADQGIATGTWYTISMTIDNAADSWTGTISGGAFATPTTLASGATTSYSFRTATGADLVNFALRANNGNSSGSLYLDNIEVAVIPEPSTYALMGGLLCLGLVVLRRRIRG